MLELSSGLIELQKEYENIIYFVPSIPELSEKERMDSEYDLLGYYITKHPLDDHKTRMNQLERISELKDLTDEKWVHIGGIISECKTIKTKAGATMAFITVEDKTGRIEIVIFAKLYEQIKNDLAKNNLIEIKGRLEVEEKEVGEDIIYTHKIIASKILPIEIQKDIDAIILKLDNALIESRLNKIKDIICNNPGDLKVFIDYQQFLLAIPYKIKQNSEVINSLRELTLIQEVEKDKTK